MDSLLDSGDNVAWVGSEFPDRLLEDAVAISNCCLVCWCMTLIVVVNVYSECGIRNETHFWYEDLASSGLPKSYCTAK